MPSDELGEIKRTLNELGKRVEKLEETVFKVETPQTEPKVSIDVDIGSLGYVKELKSALDKCLAILDHLFSKNPSHAGLTPDEFALMFREKFGFPVPLPTISARLYEETGHYVTRKKIEGRPVKYRYQILPRGQDYIRSKIASLQG